MKLGIRVKEKIARTIAGQFTTNEIVNVFADANIPTTKELFAKWRITLDAFGKTTTEEAFFHIIEEFCHPLNFTDSQIQKNFIDALNSVLIYENLKVLLDGGVAKVVSTVQLEQKEHKQEEKPKPQPPVLPNVDKSTYSERVIGLVADELVKALSNFEIRKIITPIIQKNEALFNQTSVKSYLIDEIFDENPFYTFNDVLQVVRRKDPEADKTISIIISDILHPLNFGADETKAEALAKKVSKYLIYDKLYIQNIGDEYHVFSEKEMEEMHKSEWEDNQETENQASDEKKLKLKKETTQALRDAHQAYIDIIEIFCQNPKKPTKELNDAYVFLSKKIQQIVDELGLQYHKIFPYKPFTNDLYSAEIEWNGSGAVGDIRLNAPLSWDAVRPSLYRVHSNITKIHRIAEEGDKRTGDEKTLEEITSLISQKRIQKPVSPPPEKTMKIEIAKMPDLNIRNVEDGIITKNKKRIALPKFSHTEWSKAEIRFLDERNVLLKAGLKTATADYEGLGFRNDKTGQPNKAWSFLFGLAKRGGETLSIKSPIPDDIKQKKMALADRLKAIFKNDTDPFYEFSDANTYKLKVKLIPPVEEGKADSLGIGEFMAETMTSVYEEEK